MNRSLKRAIDYLAIEDAEVCNELERGVDQISLQLVAHAFDIDPYVLLGKVWERRWAWVCGETEPIEHVKFTVTNAGVFRVYYLRASGHYWVTVIHNPVHHNGPHIGVFETRRAANGAIRKLATAEAAA